MPLTENLPAIWEPSGFDYVRAGLADFVIEGLPIHTLWNLSYIAKSPEEFFAGIQASTELKDIVLDHYDREKEPDNGSFDEQDPGPEDFLEDD